MNKNIYIILLLIVVVIAGGYYYYNYSQQSEPQAEIQEQAPADQDDTCQPAGNLVIDEVFERIDQGVVYLKTKEGNDLDSFSLSEEAVFSEITLSATLETLEQKDIVLGDLNQGDLVSVVVSCGENQGDVQKVIDIKRIIVEGGEVQE